MKIHDTIHKTLLPNENQQVGNRDRDRGRNRRRNRPIPPNPDSDPDSDPDADPEFVDGQQQHHRHLLLASLREAS